MFDKVKELLCSPYLNSKSFSNMCKTEMNWYSSEDIFPYEIYDSENEVYENKDSYGFILEGNLVLGINSQIESELETLFKRVMPEGSCLQVTLIASPKIGNRLDCWLQDRLLGDSSEILKKLSVKRTEYFSKFAYSSYHGTNTVFREFRLLISWSRSGSLDDIKIQKLKVMRSQMVSMLKSIGIICSTLSPKELIDVLRDTFSSDDDIRCSDVNYNEYDSISKQIFSSGISLEVQKDGIAINEKKLFRSYSVSEYPKAWFKGQASNLIGSNINEYLNLSCPFIISYGIFFPKAKVMEPKLKVKALNIERQARSPVARLVPSITKEAEEWNHVKERLNNEERFVKTYYQVCLIANKSEIDEKEQLLLSLYRNNRITLTKDDYIQLPSLVSILPMSWGAGINLDLSFFNKLKTTLSNEVINFLPIIGEYSGGKQQGLLLVGRRGQLFNWSQFEGMSGNFNISVVGRPGSGKSVFMQELAKTMYDGHANVYVLDVGRSFEKLSHYLDGQFVEFTSNKHVCINPFSTMNPKTNSDKDEAIGMLKTIVALMVSPKSGTTDEEDAFIEQALSEIWDEKGNKAQMNDLYEWFSNKKGSALCESIGIKLYTYSNKGVFGKIFNGKANIDFHSGFVVTELSELKNKPDLKAIVVQILILIITNKMSINRELGIKSVIVFDEAWDLLSENKNNSQGARFIEALARTLRKYNGSLIVGTQMLDDFYASSGAEAVFNNSDYLCMFSQKRESIELLAQNGKFHMDEAGRELLATVNTKGGSYSEFMMKSEHATFIGRLILDPFTRILYSSKAEEYRDVNNLVNQGLTVSDAIQQVANQRYPE